ncbi:TetR/AcrR family transcriptional regulator C-terminal domain-containing protein [Flindersiella endophytica]
MENPTRDEMITVALGLVRDRGVAGVSVRRLATALDCPASALYQFVANKDELLTLLWDEVIGTVGLPQPSQEHWRQTIVDAAQAIRRSLLPYVSLYDVMRERPMAGTHTVRFYERGLGIFTEAGFDLDDIQPLWDMLIDLVLAFVSYERAWIEHRSDVQVDDREIAEFYKGLFEDLPPEEYPYFRALGGRFKLKSRDMDGWFDRAIVLLVDGIAAQHPTVRASG